MERQYRISAGIEDKEKLTDAETESIRGHAQMLRQSGLKVDVKEDIKGDIKKELLIQFLACYLRE